MIVTLTPNPSLDRALDLDRLVLGEVNRADAVHVHPGGKGINVSRALVAQGIASLAVLPVGGVSGEQLVTLLTEQGVRTLPVPVVGPTRTNVTVVEHAGATTKINAPGTPLGLEEIDALLARLAQRSEDVPATMAFTRAMLHAKEVAGKSIAMRRPGQDWFVFYDATIALGGREYGLVRQLDDGRVMPYFADIDDIAATDWAEFVAK